MKAGTHDHLKMRRFMRLTGVRLCIAVGTLELLWTLAVQSADEGDVGKYTNEEIADYCDWVGEADDLIDALIKCRLLDEVEDERRLVIHDWLDHCPSFIKERVIKRRQRAAKKLKADSNGGGEMSTGNDHLSGDSWTTTPSVHDQPDKRTDSADKRANVPSLPIPSHSIPSHSIQSPGPGPGPDSVPVQGEVRQEEIPASLEHLTEFTVPPDPRGAGKLDHSVFDGLLDRHYGSPHAMVEWHARQLAAQHPVIGSSEAHRILAVAAGLYVDRKPDITTTKKRVFMGICNKHAWKRVMKHIPEALEHVTKLTEEPAHAQDD
ncbi:MAG TPA: hypothetical protein DCE55_29315 [Planctomycetaceae bacterium]|nr:hypothetical protein [Planctomycetaceae bacterium]|tara:strand:- start:10242 stop:11201 length:960 start_codon:yes stop_codon:yes gene_type:complete